MARSQQWRADWWSSGVVWRVGGSPVVLGPSDILTVPRDTRYSWIEFHTHGLSRVTIRERAQIVGTSVAQLGFTT